MIFKVISQYLIAFAVVAISLQLLLDPWMAERFQRAVRENTRIYTKFLDWDLQDRAQQFREALGVLGLLTSFGSFMNLQFMQQFQMLIVAAYALVYANPLTLYEGEKFAPVFLAVLFTAFLIHQSGISSKKEEEEFMAKQDGKQES